MGWQQNWLQMLDCFEWWRRALIATWLMILRSSCQISRRILTDSYRYVRSCCIPSRETAVRCAVRTVPVLWVWYCHHRYGANWRAAQSHGEKQHHSNDVDARFYTVVKYSGTVPQQIMGCTFWPKLYDERQIRKDHMSCHTVTKCGITWPKNKKKKTTLMTSMLISGLRNSWSVCNEKCNTARPASRPCPVVPAHRSVLFCVFVKLYRVAHLDLIIFKLGQSVTRCRCGTLIYGAVFRD